MISHNMNGKTMFRCCFENIDAASLHGRTSLFSMETSPRYIAFIAPVARPTPEGPGLIIAIKKNNALKINYCIIETINPLVAFLPVDMKEKSVSIGIKDFAHLVRGWCVGRAAEGFSIPGTAELAFHPHPGGCEYFRCLDYYGISNSLVMSQLCIW